MKGSYPAIQLQGIGGIGDPQTQKRPPAPAQPLPDVQFPDGTGVSTKQLRHCLGCPHGLPEGTCLGWSPSFNPSPWKEGPTDCTQGGQAPRGDEGAGGWSWGHQVRGHRLQSLHCLEVTHRQETREGNVSSVNHGLQPCHFYNLDTHRTHPAWSVSSKPSHLSDGRWEGTLACHPL